MGYNSVVVVLVDRLSEIERDPEFGKKLAAAIRYKSSFGSAKRGECGYRLFADEATGQTQVISVAHAGSMQIVAVGGNTGRVIGWSGWSADDDMIIKRLNDDRLRRRREAKALAAQTEAAE